MPGRPDCTGEEPWRSGLPLPGTGRPGRDPRGRRGPRAARSPPRAAEAGDGGPADRSSRPPASSPRGSWAGRRAHGADACSRSMHRAGTGCREERGASCGSGRPAVAAAAPPLLLDWNRGGLGPRLAPGAGVGRAPRSELREPPWPSSRPPPAPAPAAGRGPRPVSGRGRRLGGRRRPRPQGAPPAGPGLAEVRAAPCGARTGGGGRAGECARS